MMILEKDSHSPDRLLVKNESRSVLFGSIERRGREWFNAQVAEGTTYGLQVGKGPFPSHDAAFEEFKRALADPIAAELALPATLADVANRPTQ